MIDGTSRRDKINLGSGEQVVHGGDGNDRIISWADSGEPGAATQAADDVLTGGGGADRFEFRALLNGTAEVVGQHTNIAGRTNWKKVAGENDNPHDHWVEGFGQDTITDYSKAEGDTIVIKGHTVTLDSITYGSDEGGDYSLIAIYSQQGDGANGGANTATGAHDEDPLGTIKVYGDRVEVSDLTIVKNNDGIDLLNRADAAYGDAQGGTTQEVFSNTDGDSYTGIHARQTDKVALGTGSQTVDAGGGNDVLISYSDGGEPDPAQGGERINPAVAQGAADDVIKGGQGKDTFAFRLLLNATDEVLAKHTKADGSVNWRKVAGENGDVHDHWVEGIGNDTILDFSKQDGDKIDIRGHTVEIASITYDADEGGDYSLIALRSQQGDGGGAHDEDALGTIKVYGDRVESADIKLEKNVFFGIDQLDTIAAGEETARADNDPAPVEEIQWGAANPEEIDLTFTGTDRREVFQAGSGSQTIEAGGGNDRIISYADAGEPDPAQGGARVNPALPAGAADDILTGGAGADKFEFHALLNARHEVIEQHTNARGHINWGKVAGENDNVHDHWVEGIGNDTITDFSKAEGDSITVRGHTMTLDSVTYGSDEGGDYSLIRLYSQQGDGGAGGANTATGAHDEDSLGTIKVYGDRVEESDVIVQGGGVVDGVDRLPQVDALAPYNGGSQNLESTTDGDVIIAAAADVKTTDAIKIGSGAQTVDAGLGNDSIRIFSDGGEPDPAQTTGADGRITSALSPAQSTDIVAGGQGRDTFTFNFLLNATDAVLARHMRADGSINWRKVAGENEAVHDHWVESGGDDVVLDFSQQDGDKLVLRGHTVEIASITYDEDEGGDYSLIAVRSQQGEGGGAHDEDALGTIKVYGDRVTEDDITVKKNVFDGIDIFEPSTDRPDIIVGTRTHDADLTGTEGADVIKGLSGADTLTGAGGDDFLFGGGGHDTIHGGAGDDWLESGGGRDTLSGDAGNDTLVANGGHRNVLTGGEGADAFVFKDGVRSATITDFEDGLDVIDLSRMAAISDINDITIMQTGATSYKLAFENDAGRTTSVIVESEIPLALDQDDFLF